MAAHLVGFAEQASLRMKRNDDSDTIVSTQTVFDNSPAGFVSQNIADAARTIEGAAASSAQDALSLLQNGAEVTTTEDNRIPSTETSQHWQVYEMDNFKHRRLIAELSTLKSKIYDIYRQFVSKTFKQ